MLIASVGKRLSCLATLLLFHFLLFCALSSVHCLRVLFAFLLGSVFGFSQDRLLVLCYLFPSLISYFSILFSFDVFR